MSPKAGFVLLDQIAPRLRATIPYAVRPTGAEDAEELLQDATALAAQMLHSLEARGKEVTVGNVCYYVTLLMKSGRRSQSSSRTDALSPGAMLDGKSCAVSLEEPVGLCSETGETVALGDLLAGTHEDPASAAARNLDWAGFLDGRDGRYPGHEGRTSSLQVKFTPVRVVCQNTLTLAINNGQSGIKISHHTDIHQRLKAAEQMLGIVRHQFDELADTFREMVRVPMNGNRLEKYLEYVYPEPKDRLPTESEDECIARDRSWSEYFFDQGAGNRLRGVEGTLWAAYNGVTEYLDHRKIRQTADQRLTSTWFGEANRIKARALTVAVEMLPHFRN